MWVRALVAHSRCHRAASLLDKKLRSIYCVWSSPKGVPAIGFRGNRVVMNFSVASGLGEALPSLLASLFRAVYAFRVTWSERFSSRIRHRNELTEKAWEDAVQGLGKGRQGGVQEKAPAMWTALVLAVSYVSLAFSRTVSRNYDCDCVFILYY